MPDLKPYDPEPAAELLRCVLIWSSDGALITSEWGRVPVFTELAV